jgi:hypothetical protein
MQRIAGLPSEEKTCDALRRGSQMNRFHQLCRNLGLMVHNIKHPDGAVQKRVVNKSVEETRVDEKTTLRRTTIEEIEVRREHAPKNE